MSTHYSVQIEKFTRKDSKIPPPLGPSELVFSNKDKADVFAKTLGPSFQANSDPGNDEHIRKVEKEIKNYINANVLLIVESPRLLIQLSIEKFACYYCPFSTLWRNFAAITGLSTGTNLGTPGPRISFV